MKLNKFNVVTLLVFAIVLFIVAGALGSAVADVTVTKLYVWTPLRAPGAAAGGAAMKSSICRIDWDDSYPTGGESLTPSDFDMVHIAAVIKIYDDELYSYNFSRENQRLMVLEFEYSSGTDGNMIEMGNTDNLSTLSTTVLAIGSP